MSNPEEFQRVDMRNSTVVFKRKLCLDAIGLLLGVCQARESTDVDRVRVFGLLLLLKLSLGVLDGWVQRIFDD